MDTPFVVNEAYRCRLKYLWRGLQHRAVAHKQHSERQFAKPWIGALLLAPILGILLIGVVIGKTAHALVALTHAPGMNYALPVFGGCLVVALLCLPVIVAYRTWKALRRLCRHGWELSRASRVLVE
jgi:hypothetical protein